MPAGSPLRVRGIYAATARTYLARAGFLLLLGVLVFVPLGLVDAASDRVATFHVSDVSEISGLAFTAVLLGFAVQAITSLLGEVFYSGAVALTLASPADLKRPSLAQVARSLAYGRLIVLDVVFGILVVAGLLLAIVPGVIAFVWFSLAGPLIEIEGLGVREAMSRSRSLVRGHFWTVLAVLGPITLISELVTNAFLDLTHGAVHNAFLGDWFGESITNLAISPFYAVAAVLITLRLRDDAPRAGDVAERPGD